MTEFSYKLYTGIVVPFKKELFSGDKKKIFKQKNDQIFFNFDPIKFKRYRF